MVFQKTEGNRVWVDLSELVFKNCNLKHVIAKFCKLWRLRGVRVCYDVQESSLLTGWQRQTLRHEISSYEQLASLSLFAKFLCWRDACCCVRPSDQQIPSWREIALSGPLISRCRRDAYRCVRPSDQQIPSWCLLLCPALWSLVTVVTRKLLCSVRWSRVSLTSSLSTHRPVTRVLSYTIGR